MAHRSRTKRSRHELKRLVENAVADECRLLERGLWFCVDEVEASGWPPERIKVWATLHFLAAGSPFCCGEPSCQLGTFLDERMQRISAHVRRAMGLEQQLTVDLGDRIGVNRHEGVVFGTPGGAVPSHHDTPAYTELARAEHDTVWDRFCEQFKFRPSIHPECWPGIHEPMPSMTFDISSFYGRRDADLLNCDLKVKLLAALRHCLRPPARLYALDWQHPCYWFDPFGRIDVDALGLWPVPLLPDGDYYIFLAEDFSFGIFGHPWEQTMCIFGQTLVEAVEAGRPRLFARPVRKDGLPV